jgi:hypothetical protein
MNLLLKTLVGSILTLFLCAITAQETKAFELTVLGGVNYAAPTQRTAGVDIHQTGNATPTFGLFGSTSLFSSAFTIETGVVSLTQQSERDNFVPFVTQKMQFIQVPLLLRYHLDQSISLGVGGYAAFAQGNVQTTQTSVTTETPYETLFLNKTDAGLLLNIHVRFAMAPPFYAIIDARYQHGLMNMAKTQNDLLNTRSVQAMAGLSYEFETSKEAPGRQQIRIIDNED